MGAAFQKRTNLRFVYSQQLRRFFCFKEDKQLLMMIVSIVMEMSEVIAIGR